MRGWTDAPGHADHLPVVPDHGSGGSLGGPDRSSAEADSGRAFDEDDHDELRPEPLASFDPGRRGLRVLAVVAVLVVIVASVVAWRGRPKPSLIPVDATTAATAQAPVGETGRASPVGTVIVSVGGRVQRPGLVRLPAGSRVADAIEAAGGAQPGTDLSLVNLARKVVDGELVVVGVSAPPGSSGVVGGAAGGDDPGAQGGLVDLNQASLAQLQTLPGIGPVLAQSIVSYREEHSGFGSVEELRKVDGIGETRFERLKRLVTV